MHTSQRQHCPTGYLQYTRLYPWLETIFSLDIRGSVICSLFCCSLFCKGRRMVEFCLNLIFLVPTPAIQGTTLFGCLPPFPVRTQMWWKELLFYSHRAIKLLSFWVTLTIWSQYFCMPPITNQIQATHHKLWKWMAPLTRNPSSLCPWVLATTCLGQQSCDGLTIAGLAGITSVYIAVWSR